MRLQPPSQQLIVREGETRSLYRSSRLIYPVQILDIARTKASLECFPAFLRSGGVFILGGSSLNVSCLSRLTEFWVILATHFTFLREIPMFSRYETRASIASWDDKWVSLEYFFRFFLSVTIILTFYI